MKDWVRNSGNYRTMKGINAKRLSEDLRHAITGEVHFDKTYRSLFSTDASNYRQIPIGVVFPRNVQEVERAVEVCHHHAAPITHRGGGTSLAGQSCNVAVIIDTSKHVNTILEVNPAAKYARVEPGVVLDHLNNPLAAEHGLVYGPDPSTHSHCTFGGMIGNNSCGVHSVQAGRAEDNVEEMEVLTHDGIRMRVGPTSEEELSRIIADGGRRGDIYRTMRDIRDKYGRLIDEKYPDIPRRVSGYSLDALLPRNGFNVARALVGSEGTLATILEAKVRLVHSPPCRVLLVLGYPDIFDAGDHVPHAMSFHPLACEGMDEKLLSFVRKKHMEREEKLRALPQGKGWLLLEFGGDSQEEANDRARQVMEELKRQSRPPTMAIITDPEEQSTMWEIRKSALGATAWVQGWADAWPGWEDAAVDPNQLGPYLREYRDLLKRYNYDCSLYGHFGQACVHCRVTFDLSSRQGLDHWKSFLQDAADLCLKHNGSLSAEHGDGQARAWLLPKMFGNELIEAFRLLKTAWDPENRMNPGKLVDPYPVDSNLRLGAAYQPRELETHFQYPEDEGSFHRAAMRCVGVGKCRRTDNAFMCPSYIATKDERDSTRGRARALFEMTRGTFDTKGWRSDTVREALDLCLSCKGCKTECPVSVDMATYKSEFFSHYYKGRLRPMNHYSMGLIGTWAKLAMFAPGLANFVSQTAPFSTIMKKAGGISVNRAMPRFAKESFVKWYHKTQRPAQGDRQVLLYADPFNNYFFPHVLKATYHSLTKLGYSVIVPRESPPSLRPLEHYGFLDLTKKELRKAIRFLRPYARRGIPIIGLEPSTVSMFREELPNLYPHDHDGRRVKVVTKLLSEFLDETGAELPRLNGRAIMHGHCHQKAVLRKKAMRNVLERMGLDLEEPEIGCCGMAGSFGFEAEHYDVSMTIGENHLLPAVREAGPDTRIIIEGFSCHEQIVQGSGREVEHFAEVVWSALR